MKYLWFILILIALVVSFMQHWLIATAIFLTLFSVRFNTAFLIPVAIILDGYYGAYYETPWISLAAVAWFLLMEYIKPRMSAG